MKMTKNVDAISYKNNKSFKTKEKIVSDETTNLTINNMIKRSFSTIPDSLKEFAVGYMLGEGLISNFNDIQKINISETEIKATINLKEGNDNRELVLVSDSSGGWRSKIENINKVKSSLAIGKDELISNMDKLRENAVIWQKTGGTHVAAFVNEEKFILKEDVSRHVAVDKVIGAAAIENLDFSNSYVIYSGRMPADMVIKIARVGIPILASNASPSFSGYKLAEKAGITLVGFIRGDRFNIYTNSSRIII